MSRINMGVMAVVSITLIAATSVAWAQTPFGAPQIYPVGDHPQRVVAVDFDSDGWLDLATANAYSGTVSVLFGQPGGLFAGRQDYQLWSSSRYTWDLVAGDYNRDGKPDLAVVNSVGNTIDVLYGQGNRTFGAVASFAAGPEPFNVAGGDFNRDGRPDLAVTNLTSSQINILYGLPGGGFAPPVAYAAGNQPQKIVAADLNNDGRLDLAIGCYQSHTVTVWYGQSDGSFGNRVDLASQYPGDLVAADLNRDGKLELAVANGYWTFTVSVFAQQANGSLALAQQIPTHALADGLTTGDFNGDGLQDLVLALYDAYDGHSLELHYGQPDGSFSSFDLYTGYRGTAYKVTAADFDKNGGLDVAISSSNSIWILQNSTPEPATLSLLALGGIFLLRRRRGNAWAAGTVAERKRMRAAP